MRAVPPDIGGTDVAAALRALLEQLGQERRVADPFGRTAATVDPLGARTTTVYDAAGRTVATLNPLGEAVTTVYDAAGRAIARSSRWPAISQAAPQC